MGSRLHIFNRNEKGGPWWRTAQWTWDGTIRGKYRGTLAKGWWTLGRSSITNYLEAGIALGGEDNMVQVEATLPFLCRGAIGVRVPRKLTNGWIYQRREWGLRFGYVGRWAELLIASDEDMRDAASYYRDKLKAGTYDGPWKRAALWPGIHLTFRPRLRDRLLGRMECVTVTAESTLATVPMPEGNYAATIKREDRTWKRKRWPWPSQRRTDYSIDIPGGIPVPGKGENSWDCEDDGIYGTGGSSPIDAVANATRAALRQRARYAGPGWVPTAGWPVSAGDEGGTGR